MVGEAEQTARPFLWCGEVDTTIHQREKHVQSFIEADALSCGCCLVEGEAELTAHLSDKRAQSFSLLGSMMMTRGMETVGNVVSTWVGCGRVPYDYSKDSCDTEFPRVVRLRTDSRAALTQLPDCLSTAVHRVQKQFRNHFVTTWTTMMPHCVVDRAKNQPFYEPPFIILSCSSSQPLGKGTSQPTTGVMEDRITDIDHTTCPVVMRATRLPRRRNTRMSSPDC